MIMKKIIIQLAFIELFLGFGFLSAQNAYIIKNVSAITKPSNPEYLTVNNNQIYFFADDGIHGVELWKTDGTIPGTTLVKDINPNGNGLFGYYTDDINIKFQSINTILYFVASSTGNGGSGNQLWRSDGTTAGTYMLKSISTNSSDQPDYLTNLNGTLFFRCAGDLWKSECILPNRYVY